MAHKCQQAIETAGEGQKVTLYSSSGGNAGLAVATVGHTLGVPVHVVVPETAKQLVIRKLEAVGAKVTVHGPNWNAADAHVRELIAQEQDSRVSAYIPPFDDPLIWAGHASLIEEIEHQLPNGDTFPPAALLVSVGGGGLLCGVLEGLMSSSLWKHQLPQVVAVETEGADSFNASWKAQSLEKLDAITSIANTLGALQVASAALERSQQYADRVHSKVCTDSEAVEACLKFANDHRMMVEPACGASLAVLYCERFREQFLADLDREGDEWKRPIVVEVCGGSGISTDLLHQWKEQFGLVL